MNHSKAIPTIVTHTVGRATLVWLTAFSAAAAFAQTPGNPANPPADVGGWQSTGGYQFAPPSGPPLPPGSSYETPYLTTTPPASAPNYGDGKTFPQTNPPTGRSGASGSYPSGNDSQPPGSVAVQNYTAPAGGYGYPQGYGNTPAYSGEIVYGDPATAGSGYAGSPPVTSYQNPLPGYPSGPLNPTPGGGAIDGYNSPFGPPLTGGPADPLDPVLSIGPTIRQGDLVIRGYPGRTGRIMLGGAVNSDAGVTGQITVDERNFDITRLPRSFSDMFSGSAFRGAGQTFRLEAAPGTAFKRYTVSFANPNLLGYLPFSLSVSGFLYDRRFEDWDEERLGGRVALGYRVTPDLSLSVGISGQNVEIDNPSTLSVPLLNESLGDNELYGGEFRVIHDTRNSTIQASDGHYFEFRFEEMFGTYDYYQIETEFRQYWLLAQRADGTGRQTLSYSTRVGFSGDETPIFENFFAGGYATLRGFDFRGAGPVESGVQTGGRFLWTNNVEYIFPITADDAFRGVAFVDFGTVEQDIEIDADNFRVAPGMGLRVAIPMLGPAPLAFDFAYPVAKASTDDERIFSFYMSLIR